MKPKKIVYARTINMLEDADPVRISLVDSGANKKRITFKSEASTGISIKKIAFADEQLGLEFIRKNFDDADIYEESAWAIEGSNYVIYSKDYLPSDKLTEIKGDGFTLWVNDTRDERATKQSQEKTCSTLLAGQSDDRQEINMSKTIDAIIKSLESALLSIKGEVTEPEDKVEEAKEDIKEEEVKQEVANDLQIKLEAAEKALNEVKAENTVLAKQLAETNEAIKTYELKFNELLTKTEKFETDAKESQAKYESLIKSIEDSKLRSNSSEVEAAKAEVKEEKKEDVKKSAFLQICEQLVK